MDARALGAMGSPPATPSALLTLAVHNTPKATGTANKRAPAAAILLVAIVSLPQRPRSATDTAVSKDT